MKLNNGKEQTTYMIQRYMDILRIEAAADKAKEIANQKRETAVILEALGVAVDDLRID